MLLSCGDALIDFMPAKASDGQDALVPAVGGSCLNVAVAMARLGAPAGFLGGLSTDMFGRMIADHATASGVDLRHAARSDDQTTLAFVRVVEGEPHYAFHDESSAARRWTWSVGSIPFEAVDALHVGSTTLINEPSSSETLALVEEAHGRTVIHFDPNCRPALIRNREAYAACMARFTRRADIVRMSDVDCGFLFPGAEQSDVAARLIGEGASLVVITRGKKGVSAWQRSGLIVEVEASHLNIADTIGAGDSFQGAMLVALRDLGALDRSALKTIGENDLHRALRFAARCAAVTCSRPGADPPWRREVGTA
ncbi:carbohydrate kinase [Terrihabitans rhizophilus]|uniref:Carbohydrate kinase n=1 Tax=Terrihabitans rhizophilus TaxID=3092662 RepID=A0ABU4RJG2_9HYPH|nr:carbohydrate kinase [Terrihabitans sp. PJ23]MDX6804989.1 carbohydrate kinase [Terrihabitans sp. PJ23]